MAVTRSASATRVNVRDGTSVSPLLGPLLDEWSDVLAVEVLKKWLDSTDCAMLARACWKCGEAVANAGLETAGVPGMPLVFRDFVGSVKHVAWAKANGCLWNEDSSAEIAAGGHQEVLRWAHENECSWDERTTAGRGL